MHKISFLLKQCLKLYNVLCANIDDEKLQATKSAILTEFNVLNK